MALLFRNIKCISACKSYIISRNLFGLSFGKKQSAEEKEAKDLLNVFVDPLSKEELKYIPKKHVYLAESIGVEYSIKDGIYVMSPNEATLIVNENENTSK